MQQTLTVKRGTVWLNRFEGVILHSDRDRETHVSSSGVGGYVGPNGGYVAAPRIVATTTEHQILFARDGNGVESKFQWADWTLPVRPGSRIAVIWGARTGASEGPYFGAINLDTKEERWAFSAWFAAQGLVTARVRGWLCFFVSFLIASAVVYGFAFKELSGRPRPEQQVFDAAQIALGGAMRDQQLDQADKFLLGRYKKPTEANFPQRVDAARADVRTAEQALRRASTTPYDSRPTVSEIFSLVVAYVGYQVGFAAAWFGAFVVLIILAVVAAAIAAGRSVEDRRTEAEVRAYLRTGVLSHP